MLNILINAYAVSPNWGSEPGVGWNWIINIAKHCNVFVITESEWKDDIIKAIDELPQKENIHFYFNPVPEKVRKMCWNQGDWRFYWYYRKWQKRTLKIARQIIAENHIDVIHQLNMIGFREPGYLWKIKNIPLVWGPIGGMTQVPKSFLMGSSTKDQLKIQLKNHISKFQSRHGRVRKMIKRANCIMTAHDKTASILKDYYGYSKFHVMPETGLKITPKIVHSIENNRPINLLWVGRFIPTKKLDVALEILAKLNTFKQGKHKLHIVGWGTNEEMEHYKSIASELNIDTVCVWYGKIPNEQVQDLMKNSDILLFTSVVEGTPHVVLEAISNNLPVMCFDLCGQGVVVTENVGWKIPITDMESAAEEMVSALARIESNRNEISVKSQNCDFRKPELTWESKIDEVLKLYKTIINVKGI